ncbi:MAG: hypothetical protein Q8K78_12620 [Planctomycetaceae bacterium]|nr:hypothetical protein [Planctomycetaceae bacterium]
MNLAMMLTAVTVAVAVGVMGVLSAMTADDRSVRARGWVWASLGFAVGVAACAMWHNAAAGRVIALVLVIHGGIIFDRLCRHPPANEVTSSELLTERTP